MNEVEVVVKAIWEAECNPVVDDDVQGWQEMVARAAIAALDAFRSEERRKNCKHTNRTGTGMVSSDGSSYYNWYCRDCGASDRMETPARPPTETQLLFNAPVSGSSTGVGNASA